MPLADAVAEPGDLNGQTQGRYVISTDGNEVTDSVTGLIWRGCTEGMKIAANGYSGTATAYSSDQAQAGLKTKPSPVVNLGVSPSLKELAKHCRFQPL
ncbi:MAG: hypothetical protein IPN81_14285 [Nitrosomonadales bacterium]|nr:hypothetical protein [Nitrosomonadales bacterium]